MTLLLIAPAVVAVVWAISRHRSGDDYRTRNDRTAAHRITSSEARPEPPEPGNDQQLLDTCWAIWDATQTTRQHRKEKPQP